MRFLPSQLLVCYRNFKAIEANDFHGIIRYYEQHEEDINALHFDAYFDCLLAYTNALFETGAYGKHLVMSDVAIETIIMENIYNWGGEDCYAKLLFRKAAALFYLKSYDQAAHVLKEMVKLYPENGSACLFYHKCLHHHKPLWLTQTRAWAMAVFMLSILLGTLHILLIIPFFPDLSSKTEAASYTLVILGAVILFSGELAQNLRCRKVVLKTKRAGRLRKKALG